MNEMMLGKDMVKDVDCGGFTVKPYMPVLVDAEDKKLLAVATSSFDGAIKIWSRQDDEWVDKYSVGNSDFAKFAAGEFAKQLEEIADEVRQDAIESRGWNHYDDFGDSMEDEYREEAADMTRMAEGRKSSYWDTAGELAGAKQAEHMDNYKVWARQCVKSFCAEEDKTALKQTVINTGKIVFPYSRYKKMICESLNQKIKKGDFKGFEESFMKLTGKDEKEVTKEIKRIKKEASRGR